MTEETLTSAPARKPQRRGGRAGRAGATVTLMDETVPSPCVAVCAFNGESFCQGCYRNQDEIREWMIMTREQKLEVLDRISDRREADTGEQFW